MQSLRKYLVSKWKNNPIVDALIFCIVLAVIASTTYLAHGTRVRVDTYNESFKIAQQLSDRRWRMFFKSNPEVIVPRQFFNSKELSEHVEMTIESTLPEATKFKQLGGFWQ